MEEQEGEVSVLFYPGWKPNWLAQVWREAGLEADFVDGRIIRVEDGSRAQKSGVLSGMFMRTIAGRRGDGGLAYSKDLLDMKIGGTECFEITFSDPVKTDEMLLREEIWRELEWSIQGGGAARGKQMEAVVNAHETFQHMSKVLKPFFMKYSSDAKNINLMEFRLLMTDVCENVSEEETQALFHAADMDKNKGINFEAFMACIMPLAFTSDTQSADEPNQGMVLRRIHGQAHSEDLLDTKSGGDEAIKNTEMTLRKQIRRKVAWSTGAEFVQNMSIVLGPLFLKYDSNDENSINLMEFRLLLTDVCENVSEEKTKAIFDAADMNKSNCINFETCVAAVMAATLEADNMEHCMGTYEPYKPAPQALMISGKSELVDGTYVLGNWEVNGHEVWLRITSTRLVVYCMKNGHWGVTNFDLMYEENSGIICSEGTTERFPHEQRWGVKDHGEFACLDNVQIEKAEAVNDAGAAVFLDRQRGSQLVIRKYQCRQAIAIGYTDIRCGDLDNAQCESCKRFQLQQDRAHHDWLVQQHNEVDLNAVEGPLLQSIRSGAVACVRGSYVAKLWASEGEVIQRRQDMPYESLWAAGDLEATASEKVSESGDVQGWRRRLYAVSYAWVTPSHPDPARFHLSTLGPVVKACLEGARSELKTHETEYQSKLKWNAADKFDIGIFWDFPSLYQKAMHSMRKNAGERTEAEKQLFLEGLNAANYWYGHILTTTWMLTAMPEGTPYHLQYSQRGWPFFEMSVSGLLKEGIDCLDLANVDLTSKEKPYLEICKEAMSNRLPPLAPGQLDAELDRRQFTNGSSDRDMVKALYRRTFNDMVKNFDELCLYGLGWDWRQAEVLEVSLPHYIGLKCLALPRNHLDSRAIRMLARGFSKCPALHTVALDGNETLGDDGAEALANAFPMPDLKKFIELSLCNCSITGRGARALVPQWFHHIMSLCNADMPKSDSRPFLFLEHNFIDPDCDRELSKFSVFVKIGTQNAPEGLLEKIPMAQAVEEINNTCQSRRTGDIDVIERSPVAVQQKACCVLM